MTGMIECCPFRMNARRIGIGTQGTPLQEAYGQQTVRLIEVKSSKDSYVEAGWQMSQ
jgi:hypothetical protein